MIRTHVSENRGPIVVEPREQSDRYGMKPKGFWFEVNADWRRWCRGEMPHWIEGRTLHRVTLGEERMLSITSVAEIDAFNDEYLVTEWRPGYSERYGPMDMGIRWGAVAAEYDGIEIAPYLWDRRLDGPTWYYGWDCASGVIWRPRGVRVERMRTLPLRNILKLTAEEIREALRLPPGDPGPIEGETPISGAWPLPRYERGVR